MTSMDTLVEGEPGGRHPGRDLAARHAREEARRRGRRPAGRPHQRPGQLGGRDRVVLPELRRRPPQGDRQARGPRQARRHRARPVRRAPPALHRRDVRHPRPRRGPAGSPWRGPSSTSRRTPRRPPSRRAPRRRPPTAARWPRSTCGTSSSRTPRPPTRTSSTGSTPSCRPTSRTPGRRTPPTPSWTRSRRPLPNFAAGAGAGLASLALLDKSRDYKAGAARVPAQEPRVRRPARPRVGRHPVAVAPPSTTCWARPSGSRRAAGSSAPAGILIDIGFGVYEATQTGDWTRAALTTGTQHRRSALVVAGAGALAARHRHCSGVARRPGCRRRRGGGCLGRRLCLRPLGRHH